MDNFFQKQDLGRARSRAFYMAFSLAVAGAVVLFYFVVTGCFLTAGIFSPFRVFQPGSWWENLVQHSLPPLIYGDSKEILALRPMLIMVPALAAFILLLSYYKTRLIKNGGGAYVVEAMGGVPVGKPKNADEKRLVNVVEEIALAAGLPKPRVFIMPKEWSINAITAGLDYEDAVIAVTDGALKHLDRDELQGVVAHEYGHILNGDYALNLTMAGWLYGLLFFSVQGRDMMAIVKDSVEKPNSAMFMIGLPMYLMGLVLWIGGSIGKLAAELAQAAMSRQREQAADAFAVQFTRNPRGLAMALKKIAAFPKHGIIKSGQALLMESFFIASPGRLRGLLRSHPPLEDRILALEPNWNGDLPGFDIDLLRPAVNIKNEKLKPVAGEVNAVREDPSLLFQKAEKIDNNWVGALVLGMLAGCVGQYETADEAVHKSLEISRRLYEKMPPELRSAADDPGLISSLIAAVFLHDAPESRQRQEDIISRLLGADSLKLAVKFKELLEPCHRLPLLGLSSPVLMSLSEEAGNTLAKTVASLISADGRLDLFEIAALQILKKRLKIKIISGEAEEEDQTLPGVSGYIEGIKVAVVVVISVMARLNERTDDDEKAKEAFRAGMAHFNHWPAFEILPRDKATARDLLLALNHLEREAPQNIKIPLALAAISAALHDNFTLEKYELLRALAAALDVPLPYFAA